MCINNGGALDITYSDYPSPSAQTDRGAGGYQYVSSPLQGGGTKRARRKREEIMSHDIFAEQSAATTGGSGYGGLFDDWKI